MPDNASTDSTSRAKTVHILNPSAALATKDGWDAQADQWGSIIASGMLPAHIQNAGQATTIALYGETFGWTAVESCMKLCVIKGKVTMYAETLSGLMLKHANANGEVYQPVERSMVRAAIMIRRLSYPEPFVFEYTQKDATAAGLWGKGTWKAHPKAMLWARVVSLVSRSAYADVTGGAYVNAEIEGQATFVQVDQLDDDTPLSAALAEPEPIDAEVEHADDEYDRTRAELDSKTRDVAKLLDICEGDAANDIVAKAGLTLSGQPTLEQCRALIGAAGAILALGPP